MTFKTAAFAILALGASTSLASAATYQISVWTGAPDGVNATTIADAAHKPTGLASAMFTYTGDINFYSAQQASNTLGQFVGFAGGTISGGSSPRGTYTSFEQAMSAVLSTSGDTVDSFFEITTAYTNTSNQIATVTHDDGASLYVDGIAQFQSANETTATPNVATLAAGTHTLTIDYVEANGAPSVLNVAIKAVPEPGMVGALGASLVAAAGLVRRRR